MKKNDITVRSGAAEYLTYVAAVSEKEDRLFMSVFDRYLLELENEGK